MRNDLALVEGPIGDGGSHFLQTKSYHEILSKVLYHD